MEGGGWGVKSKEVSPNGRVSSCLLLSHIKSSIKFLIKCTHKASRLVAHNLVFISIIEDKVSARAG